MAKGRGLSKKAWEKKKQKPEYKFFPGPGSYKKIEKVYKGPMGDEIDALMKKFNKLEKQYDRYKKCPIRQARIVKGAKACERRSNFIRGIEEAANKKKEAEKKTGTNG